MKEKQKIILAVLGGIVLGIAAVKGYEHYKATHPTVGK